MSTICFDVKRVDENYVCIQHCDTNMFNYQYHLPLSFYPRKRKGQDHWWLQDKKYTYVWIAVEKDPQNDGIERIVWACNDKIWFNRSVREFYKDSDIRVIKLPFRCKKGEVSIHGTTLPRWEVTDMKDKFKLYCPIDLNEKHHIYTDHYEEIDPVVTDSVELDNGEVIEFKQRRFNWIAPKYLEGKDE